MHGRLKVKTTEEQAECKKREQQEKLKLYLKITSKIAEKRTEQSYDEEGLELSARILEKNPDFYSLWNFRREILLIFKNKKTEDEIKKLCLMELDLTQNCLRVNPKSYGTWHHRFWVNNFNPDADWKRELKLCNYFHSLDERNFHCWNYRRLVCMKCTASPEEELSYTTELINSNFSNYSAWHYRTKLLPIVHPGATKGSVQEEILLREFDLVQNASFTDPEDQSVWFYHRWLLGRSEKPVEILNLSILKEHKIIAVLLSKPIKVNNKSLLLKVNNIPTPVVWTSVSLNPPSTLWVCDLPPDLQSVVVYFGEDALSCDVTGSSVWKMHSRAYTIRSELSAAAKDVLQKELESCQQLSELEPNCKWTLFTCVLLMRALNNIKYQGKIHECMENLKQVDALRKNYYKDLGSKFAIGDCLEVLPLNAKEVNLSRKELTSLHYCDQLFLIQSLDLSCNQLTSVHPLRQLMSLKRLVLDDNRLSNLDGLEGLAHLTCLSAKRNLIVNADVLLPLKVLKNLQELNLEENPISTTFEPWPLKTDDSN